MEYTGGLINPMIDLNIVKLHVNSIIYDTNSHYMGMNVKKFHLKNCMERVEYIMIHTSMITE